MEASALALLLLLPEEEKKQTDGIDIHVVLPSEDLALFFQGGKKNKPHDAIVHHMVFLWASSKEIEIEASPEIETSREIATSSSTWFWFNFKQNHIYKSGMNDLFTYIAVIEI